MTEHDNGGGAASGLPSERVRPECSHVFRDSALCMHCGIPELVPLRRERNEGLKLLSELRAEPGAASVELKQASECAAALSLAVEGHKARAEKYEAKLAAANALLAQCLRDLETDPHAEEYYAGLIDGLRGHLAGLAAAGEHPSEPSTDTLRHQAEYWRNEALAGNALLKRWSNFDFDCPDEYNQETGEEEEDGWALGKLYEDTAAHLAGQPRCACTHDSSCPVHRNCAGCGATPEDCAVRNAPLKCCPDCDHGPLNQCPLCEGTGVCEATQPPKDGVLRCGACTAGKPEDCSGWCGKASTSEWFVEHLATRIKAGWDNALNRIAAEQTVLDAVKDWVDRKVAAGHVRRAELARREVK